MSNWFLDNGIHIDLGTATEIDVEVEFSIVDTYTHNAFLDRELEINTNIELELFAGVALDLLQLVPEKFRSSQILIDYLSEAGLQVGSWMTKVEDIVKLENPYTVSSMDYLRQLGVLIGVKFPPEDDTSELEMRKTLAQAIDWYKLKGTYQAEQIIALIYQFTINIYDMYTNNYSDFSMVEWFVGDEDENPSGFDNTYYKSPHFGLEILLNRVYEYGSLSYLWRANYSDNFIDQIEEQRPVHTVPHYLILLNPKTDEFGHSIEVDGEIYTKVLGSWEVASKYFDMVGSPDFWNFDDGTYFDQSETAFLKSITKWVLGTGNYPYSASAATTIETPVLTGSIDPDDITIEDDKIIFEFIIPKAIVQDDITELGLYVPGSPDTLMILSVFPKVNKSNSVEMHVQVEVYKSDLS